MTAQKGRGYNYLLLGRVHSTARYQRHTKTYGASHMTDGRRMERVGGVLTNQTKV